MSEWNDAIGAAVNVLVHEAERCKRKALETSQKEHPVLKASWEDSAIAHQLSVDLVRDLLKEGYNDPNLSS